MQELGKKMMEDQSVSTQTLLVEETSTPKESLRVSFSDVVTQKLFDSITLAGRNLEVPRRKIDLGYNELEETNYKPYIGSGERSNCSYSHSDLSRYKSNSQGYDNNSEDYKSSMVEKRSFSLLVMDNFLISKRMKNQREVREGEVHCTKGKLGSVRKSTR